MPDKVGKYNLKIAWKIEVNSKGVWKKVKSLDTNHVVYLTYGVPVSPEDSPKKLAFEKTCSYAQGEKEISKIAGKIMSGIHGDITYDSTDPIDSDPLDAYSNGKGTCNDFANLMAKLCRSIGIEAYTEMVWAGIGTLNRTVYFTSGSYLASIYVSPNWAFTYHVITRIPGVGRYDAALNHTGDVNILYYVSGDVTDIYGNTYQGSDKHYTSYGYMCIDDASKYWPYILSNKTYP